MNSRARVLTLSLVALAALAAAPDKGSVARVATLLPSVEGALRGVDGVTVVAGVRNSFRAPERKDVIDLGSPHHPNVERLASARAHWVVGDAQINAPLEKELGRFGGKVVLIDTTSVDGTLDGLLAFGRQLGAEAALAPRVAQARAGIEKQALTERIPVLALFGTPGSFQVVTRGAWIGSLLEELNFENLGANLKGDERVPGFVAVSSEHLATLKPQLVVLVAHGDPAQIQKELEQQMSGTGAWAGLGRSATRGVHVLSPELFVANPGLDLPHAAEALAALARAPAAAAR
jgi:iron complex transport system substrate-binding protein